MSAQLIEILFLAGVAFFIISKFISILGTTDEDDPARKFGSHFGEPASLKDVTGTVPEQDDRVTKILSLGKKMRKLEAEADDHLKAVYEKFPHFDGDKFLGGAKAAFPMIITALHAKDTKTLGELVDKRFLSQLHGSSAMYGKMKSEKIKASLVDSYSFGNSVYVKVLFEGSNITDKIKNLNEEWVFTKNVAQSGPDWHLSNIDRPS